MKNILEKIVAKKKEEISQKRILSFEYTEKNYLDKPLVSLKNILLRNSQPGIIAEFKRRSPSKGYININAGIEETTEGYIKAGASALSILTDETFFGGKNEDLITARGFNQCPILRKDFIISEYQVYETKSIGADVILLIASILTPEETTRLAMTAKRLGLEVLLEIHTERELDRINEFVDIVGVNNRNLNDFSVSIDRSLELFNLIPNDFIKISESGIDTPEKFITLKQKGYRGFLMGERFMATANPPQACAEFIRSVKILGMDNKISYNEN